VRFPLFEAVFVIEIKITKFSYKKTEREKRFGRGDVIEKMMMMIKNVGSLWEKAEKFFFCTCAGFSQ
jgi:hypothetical protein